MLMSWLLALCFEAIFLETQTGVASQQVVLNNALQVRWEWKFIDFEFSSDQERQQAIDSGRYNHSNCFPIDVDQWQDTTFVTIIRDKGVPASLNTISKKRGDGGPLLKPYPDWSWYNNKNCEEPHITSVYRVAIDKCDRLWVLDTGVNGADVVCPPQLLSFDLTTNKLLKTIKIPENVAVNSTSGNGLLITPVVQTFGFACWKTVVYMADVSGYAIVVYDNDTGNFSRVTSSALDFDPSVTTYTIEGESFTLDDGPLGMALSSTGRNLYLSPMSSKNMVSVKTKQLRNSQEIDTDVPFNVYKDILSTQSSAKAMSNTGILFLGLVNNTSIACWNEHKPLTRNNIVVIAQNSNTLQFTSGMKVKTRPSRFGKKEVLMALTNRYQKIALGTLNFNETNFRILERDVSSLVKNTLCQARYPLN